MTEASIQDNIPTWRFYYNATIPNVQPAGYPTLGAFHGAELSIVWGTYPTENVTDQEIALSTAMQTAWATFAKNPVNGPGWKALDATCEEVACIGCDGSFGIQTISADVIDARCAQYTPLFNATSPYF